MNRDLAPTVELEAPLTPAVITVSGTDRIGVSAAFFRVLTAHGAQILDVEQSKFRGYLSLAAYIGIDPKRLETLTIGLRDTLSAYQQTVTVELRETVGSPKPYSTHEIIVLGNPVRAADISRIAQTLANYEANIDTIRGISDYPVTGLEFKITMANADPGAGVPVRKALAALSSEQGIDIAIERAGLQRRSTRLICFDCDSTLITGEVIEMLAARTGRELEVKDITDRAMRGELDFEESLRARVRLLKGLDARLLKEVAKDIVLTPGARTTIRTLKRMGYKTAVVSGGFIEVLQDLAADLELDYVRANTLEINNGVLTGEVLGTVVDRRAKAEFLAEFAADSGLQMHQTVAVGDGANDIDMISAAGLGIAFNAKPVLKEIADTSVNSPFLDEVLYILGISRAEIESEDTSLTRRVPLNP
ncbi:phosphoserine phosphatase SerB [Corynebacterium sp. ES2794-CONJ1]|uniref:phosphoserine phosphatase SerB n=1 Tax=unclassified Corynebacterium TaxID=2624378 RepID=UPI0021673645|nr:MULTISPECIES: phosphoserine phosphatase SerB [unclassified Corynebacterium]MCS4490643.1 phosphoserine phosphatase SerB [Corynebacterium sp. ES2775-CONJ]MCS4492445.1 phosphoserine phosphatase SerB [Corynebacterium sp. ES2715-CONJ3]MCU9519986.1 phosphoserine phosphatase SerB [Corynebacterium sp. ES2794-CONJ1]